MTTPYQPFRESDIPITCFAPREAVAARPDDGDPGDRGRDVWHHASISGESEGCLVIRHRHSGLVCCSHPNHQRFGQRKPCRHLQTWLFWRTYDEWRERFAAMGDDELRVYERLFAAVAAKRVAGTRGWEAQWAALADIIAERMAQRVAA